MVAFLSEFSYDLFPLNQSRNYFPETSYPTSNGAEVNQQVCKLHGTDRCSSSCECDHAPCFQQGEDTMVLWSSSSHVPDSIQHMQEQHFWQRPIPVAPGPALV